MGTIKTLADATWVDGTPVSKADVRGVTNQVDADVVALRAHEASTTNPHAVTKAQVGLDQVDNTSDVNKPVSTAQQTALDAKADASGLSGHLADTTNPHAVTKAQVGLGLADNTSDADKPVSIAQQAALDVLVPDTFGNSTEVAEPEEQDLVLLRKADGTLRVIPAWNLVEDMIPKHWFNAGTEVGATAATIIAANDELSRLRLQNLSETANIAIALGGRKPALNSPDSITLAPGQAVFEDSPEPGAVTAIGGAGSIPLFCTFARRTDVNPNAEAAWDALLARFATTPTAAWQTALKTLHTTLFNDGVLARMRGFYLLAGPDAVSARLNWVADNSASVVNGPIFTAKQGYGFDGIDDYIDTGLMLQNLTGIEITNAAMWVKPDMSDQATGIRALGDAVYEVGPNITATTFAVQGGSTTANSISGSAGYGSLVGVQRDNGTTFDAIADGAVISTVTKNSRTTWVNNNVLIGAGVVSGSAGNFYKGQIRWAGFGVPMTAAQIATLDTAMTQYLDDISGI